MRSFLIGVAVLSGIAGCGTSTAPTPIPTVAVDSKYLLTAEPGSAQDVIAVRAQAQNDDELVVVGRIGGDAKPWVSGQAAFTIVDKSLAPCGADEGCPTPWDYCCASGLKQSKLMVKVVDDQGQPVMTDARQLLGVKELDTVVVRGTAQRDQAGNITILAKGLFLKR